MLPDYVIEKIKEDLDPTLRDLAVSAVTALEGRRGKPYSLPHKYNKQTKIEGQLEEMAIKQVNLAWTKLNGILKLPNVPPELARYEASCERHEQLIYRSRIDADEPGPKKPKEVMRFEKDLGKFKRELNSSARKQGLGWGKPFLSVEAAKLASQMPIRRESSNPRKKIFRGTQVATHSSLVGDFFFGDEVQPPRTGEMRRRLENFTRERGIDLVFVEELEKNGQPRAEFERHNESYQHHCLASDMTGILRRQGFDVYPGGVGVSGIYAMADLLAIGPDNSPLFVECLTKKSISLGGHIGKLDLALAVPMCFVGPLPSNFVQKLPEQSYCIEYPRAPRTIDGKWVPGFYRNRKFEKFHFLGAMVRGRKIRKIQITMPGLRLEEDASGFLWAALCSHLFSRASPGASHLGYLGDGSGEWSVSYPQACFHAIPFDRHGKPFSTFSLSSAKSDLKIRLSASNPVIELRGGDEALDMIMTWLERAGASLKISENSD